MYEVFCWRKNITIVCSYTVGEIQFVSHPSGEIERFESYGSIEPSLKGADRALHLFDVSSYPFAANLIIQIYYDLYSNCIKHFVKRERMGQKYKTRSQVER